MEDKIIKAKWERDIEAESAIKRAQFLLESVNRRMNLEEKRKEVERLAELKKHYAAQARLQVEAETNSSTPSERG